MNAKAIQEELERLINEVNDSPKSIAAARRRMRPINVKLREMRAAVRSRNVAKLREFFAD